MTAFWLVFTRWLAVLLQFPLFDNVTVPSSAKVLMALLISYAFYPFVKEAVLKDVTAFGVNNFWYMTILNTLIGLFIGYLVKIIMDIYQSAGNIITQQIGFASIRYFDTSSNGGQIGPFEHLIQWSMIIIILGSGAIIPMFKAVQETFTTIGLTNLAIFKLTPEFFLLSFKSIFLSALTLAAPMIYTNMLIMVVLGVIARSVPQMNVLMVSFALNIGVGLLIFFATTDEFYQVAYGMYAQSLGEWFEFVR